jgi:hypothetical protein
MFQHDHFKFLPGSNANKLYMSTRGQPDHASHWYPFALTLGDRVIPQQAQALRAKGESLQCGSFRTGAIEAVPASKTIPRPHWQKEGILGGEGFRTCYGK